MKWHEYHNNLIGLAEWMDEEGFFSDTAAVIRYFEKPWKWTNEWELWQLWLREDSPDVRELIVEAACEGDMNAEQFIAEMEENDESE